MSLTLHQRDECDDFGTNCPPRFRPTNYAIIIAGILIVISLASCFVLRNRRRRRNYNVHPRLQHYSNGPAHIAEFIRLPPPPRSYVPRAPYQFRQQRRPPVFEPAPPYDHAKGPPQMPLNPPPPLISPPPSHAPPHDPPGEPPPPPPPPRPLLLQAASGAELNQHGLASASTTQANVPPVEYPPPSYSRV